MKNLTDSEVESLHKAFDGTSFPNSESVEVYNNR